MSVATFLKPDVIHLVGTASAKHLLDYWTLIAQVEKESSGNTNAIRFEPSYRWLFPQGSEPTGDELVFQRTSWGLLQIMGATARELGYTAPAGVWPAGPLKADPAAALDLGCRYLVKMYGRWGNIRDALSAYNAGRPTPDNFGTYVEPILERRDALREAAL